MTDSRSSVTVTSMAVASTLMAEMGIPGLCESFAILDQERPQTVDFRRPKAMGLRQTDRLQPKLRDVVAVFDVDVRRFGALEAIKEESEARYPQYSRHGLPQKTILAVTPVNVPTSNVRSTLKSS
jgi:hypothetical protein